MFCFFFCFLQLNQRTCHLLQKCAINLCPQVSRTEDVDSCQYKEKCRFNHDIQAFKAQVLSTLAWSLLRNNNIIIIIIIL